MIFDHKKFNEEIKELPRLLNSREGLSSADLTRVKDRVFQKIQNLNETNRAVDRLTLKERSQTLLRYVISALLGLSLVGGTALASNSSKPGDFLYPVKRAKEKIELNVAVSEQSRANLEANFAHERLNELVKLSAKPKVITGSESNATSTNPIELDARNEAEVQINHAIERLNKVKINLEAKGNVKAAAVIGENILRLEADAEAHSIAGIKKRSEKKKEKERGSEEGNKDKSNNKERSNKSSSSTNSEIRIENNLKLENDFLD